MSKKSADRVKFILTLSLLSFLFVSCDNSGSLAINSKQSDSGPLSGDIVVYAAASLTDSLREIVANFERENPRIKVYVSVGSSAQLAKQIAHGAPADIFLSANVNWMDYLEGKRFIASKTRFEPLGNRLALISNINNKNPIHSIQYLMTDRVKRIAIADYDSVPAGIYAKKALEKLNIWQNILSRLVIGNDVRVAMAYVERNEADYGIVYVTDARVSKKIKEIFLLPKESQPSIRYSFSVIKEAPNVSTANALIDYLKNDYSKHVFEKYGFEWILEKI